ncbi:hypothetical protein J4T85_005505 [Sinorhizobium medicae]|uniref:hypothetical protein n=1 Tax=Sinorhizobium medicae TaxID=110321 RepID=UPI001AAF6585|nr:hypothetical protein [Sinorhizobium medicae]MBO1962612.1 hypothetical protein [Sinorhizobium medicae]
MFKINSGFMGVFKLGDNINFNLSVASALYIAREATQSGLHRRALCKPICVELISIIEALLYDLHVKARINTREGVGNILASALEYIRTKRLDKMDHLLKSAKKHNLLGDDEAFYEELDYLRLVRNRVHIQNDPPKLDQDEHRVFTDETVERAEKALERTLRYMSLHHQRPDHARGHVKDFSLPWDAHYPDEDDVAAEGGAP